MEKLKIQDFKPGSEMENILDHLSNSMEEKTLNRMMKENLALDIDDLLNHNRMEQYLENYGYQIPKLFVERKETILPDIPDDFQLPQRSHDIYEETTYQEFHAIIARLQSQSYQDQEEIYFKFDFRKIWDNL